MQCVHTHCQLAGSKVQQHIGPLLTHACCALCAGLNTMDTVSARLLACHGIL